jgi:hypothetical protein
MSAVVAFAVGSLANTAEITSNNIRSGAAFDNLKASWNQALKLGDFNTALKCNYDYNANRDFLDSATLSGNLVEASNDDDVGVAYEMTHNFGSKKTDLKLTANTQGNTLSAEINDKELTEVSAQRDVDVGDNKVNVDAGWMVKAKTARVKLMSALGSDDNIKLQVDYDTADGAASYEVGYERNIEDGRDVSATFNPADKNLDVEYRDTKFESGATWTASASVPTEGGNNVLDAATLKLKRSWSW